MLPARPLENAAEVVLLEMLRAQLDLLVQPAGHLRHLDIQPLCQAIDANDALEQVAGRHLQLQRGVQAERRGEVQAARIAGAANQRDARVRGHLGQIVLDEQRLERLGEDRALDGRLGIAPVDRRLEGRALLLGRRTDEGGRRAHDLRHAARGGRGRISDRRPFERLRNQSAHLLQTGDLGGRRRLERARLRRTLRNALVRQQHLHAAFDRVAQELDEVHLELGGR